MLDKYELAAEGSSDSDEGIAVSAAVLKTDKPEEKLREFREAAQDERINKLSQAVEVLAMKTERTAGAIDRPFCDGCRITGHTMANCRFNPAAPNYCGHAKGEGRRHPNQSWRPRQEPPAPPQERDPRGDQPEGGFGNNRKRGRMMIPEITRSADLDREDSHPTEVNKGTRNETTAIEIVRRATVIRKGRAASVGVAVRPDINNATAKQTNHASSATNADT